MTIFSKKLGTKNFITLKTGNQYIYFIFAQKLGTNIFKFYFLKYIYWFPTFWVILGI